LQVKARWEIFQPTVSSARVAEADKKIHHIWLGHDFPLDTRPKPQRHVLVEAKAIVTHVWFEGFKIGLDFAVADKTKFGTTHKMPENELHCHERKRCLVPCLNEMIRHDNFQ